MATHMGRTDAAVWRAAATVLDLFQGMGGYGADMEVPDKACSTLVTQMMLPLRHVSLGLHMQSDEPSDAAFVAGTGQAERNLKGRRAVLCPLQGASGGSVRERWSSLHAQYAEQCKWDAIGKDLPKEVLDSRNMYSLLGAQQLETRKGDDACHAAMLSSFGLRLKPTHVQRGAARLHTSSGRPAGAFLTAIPVGGMKLGNSEMFVVSVCHRMVHRVSVAPPPCKFRAGGAADADHSMVCQKVANMTQLQKRHDNLAIALRLFVSACTCQSSAEPRYRALAGKKGMVECQCPGDIVAVLRRLEPAAVDVVVAHASAKIYAAQAAKTAGWTAASAEQTKRTRFRTQSSCVTFLPRSYRLHLLLLCTCPPLCIGALRPMSFWVGCDVGCMKHPEQP